MRVYLCLCVFICLHVCFCTISQINLFHQYDVYIETLKSLEYSKGLKSCLTNLLIQKVNIIIYLDPWTWPLRSLSVQRMLKFPEIMKYINCWLILSKFALSNLYHCFNPANLCATENNSYSNSSFLKYSLLLTKFNVNQD